MQSIANRPGACPKRHIPACGAGAQVKTAEVQAGPVLPGAKAQTVGPEDEFFAVATEYHFSAPDLLEQEMPVVAGHLRRFYGAPPAF